jgi:ABC-type multidrug transport system fused ATPase/permease subunit
MYTSKSKIMKKESEESYFRLFKKAYHKCKEAVNVYLFGLAYILTYISSALEAISLGLVVPLLERVIYEKEASDMGIIQQILDYLPSKETSDIIIFVAIMIFASVVLKNLFSYVAGWIQRVMSNNIDHTLRTRIMKEYMHRDFLFFEKSQVGDLSFTLNLSAVFSNLLEMFHVTLKNVFFCLSYAAVMIYISPNISLFIGITFIPVYLVFRWIKKLVEKIAEETVQVGSKFSIKTLEILSAIRLIKTYASEEDESRRYGDLSKKSRDLAVKLGNRTSLVGVVEEPIMTLGIMLLAGVAFFYFMENTKGGIAGFMAFFVILRRFEFALRNTITGLTGIAQQKPRMSKFLKSFKKEEWMIIKPGDKKFKGLKRGIDFKNVDFSYENNGDHVLNNINLKIPKGKTTALVGESGSGKTTLAMLIPRLFDLKKGEILIDSINVKKYDLVSLRKNMGIVSQDVEILSRTVKENICFGLERKVNKKELIEVAKKAQIYEFIKSLPDKFDTLLGERGMDLSGGQKQRISIARAILKNPSILILDEATSALDTETEREIQKAIESAFKGKTVIAIAHRLSTIENADKIVVIEKGNIVEHGGFKELLKKKGRFYHFWQIQTSIE